MDPHNRAADPIFLVGAERSGTTLLRLMLDHHPRIAWQAEFEYAVDRITGDDNWPDLDAYREWLPTRRIFREAEFTIDPELDYPQLVRSFLDQKREREDREFLGATVHRSFHRLARIWPRARYIHIVRDGRDVVRSGIAMGWAGNMWIGADLWLDAERLWDDTCESIPASERFELRFEALIAEPRETLTALCEFIGVSFDERMLSYPKDTTYGRPDKDLLQQWRGSLNEREIRRAEARMGTMLCARGYELSGLPALEVSSPGAVVLRLHDLCARMVFRMKRYGLSVVLQVFLARRMHLRKWERRLLLRIDSINRRFVK